MNMRIRLLMRLVMGYFEKWDSPNGKGVCNIIWFGVLVGTPFLLILGNYGQIWPKLRNRDKKKIASS